MGRSEGRAGQDGGRVKRQRWSRGPGPLVEGCTHFVHGRGGVMAPADGSNMFSSVRGADNLVRCLRLS